MGIPAKLAAVAACVTLICSASLVFGASLPACDSQVLTRRGDRVTMSMADLTNVFNQRLQSSNSHFTDLQLSPEGNHDLKVTGKKNGTPMSISGPLQTTSGGNLQLHAKHITKNGNAVKGMMSLFGQDLADYVNLHHTSSLSAHGNNLRINVDKLLNLSGKVTSVQLKDSHIEMQFASQPCQ